MSGFPVDAGMMTICDVKVANVYREFLSQWYKENPGKNHYDDYFAAFFAQSYEMFPASEMVSIKVTSDMTKTKKFARLSYQW